MREQRTPLEPEISIPVGALQWTDAQKQAWHELHPAAIYLVGTTCAVSGREHAPNGRITRQWGGSFGVQLVRYGVSLAVPWSTSLPAAFSKGPVSARLHWRLWTWDESKAFNVGRILANVLHGAAVEDGSNNYYSIAHDHSTESILREVKAQAQLVTNFCATDFELRSYCTQVVRLADARAAKGRRG